MTMEDVEGEVFGCMVHWFYTQKDETQSDGTRVDDLPKFVKLWILAERCILPRLQNAALTNIYNHLNNIFTPLPTGDTIPDAFKQVIDIIFSSAEQYDIMRKLLVDVCAAQGSKTLGTLIPHMPQALMVGVILELSQDRDASKSKHQILKVEKYQVEILGEKKVQPAVEKEGNVERWSRFDFSVFSHFERDDEPRPRPKRLVRPIKTPAAVHGLPAANRIVHLNPTGSTLPIPSKRKLGS
jgi:hypothetical protein